MKIAVYGASGMVGSRIAAEAVSRGHEVTGITRSGGELPAGVQAVQGSANDVALAKEFTAEADVLVAALGPSRTAGDHQDYLDAIDNLIAAVSGTTTRLLTIGGAGGLEINGSRVVDGPDFPAEYKGESLTVAQALEVLRATGDDVNWTMLAPAFVIAPGERTGAFRLGLDEPVGDHISAENFAVAAVDELERPAHNRRRFTLGY
ncbi:NAD-dependent epimerase/dehydratase family protein [Kribbella capetownensis]|uniref:NAD-dependent epimerase/dehydratase family protein n=1 Tax=Kribbella capetownensis TaxID=1572659 RepID=A0A4R0JWQ4_9ACTN|nr:NAD(P)H-binding protein [Kribbella capetownensis]TCC46735.1 NAD-dependent epimerase/dehydratase family protein [Kribbella capetownensis]